MDLNLNFFNKKNVTILIFIFLSYFVLSYILNYFFPMKSHQEYLKDQMEKIYKQEIKGRIEFIDIIRDNNTHIYLYNDSLFYSIPYTRSLQHEPHTLHAFLAIGDSIYKPKFDYSITIVRNGGKTNWILGKDER